MITRGGKEAFVRVINILEVMLPMDKLNKKVLNSPIRPLAGPRLILFFKFLGDRVHLVEFASFFTRTTTF